MNLCSGCMIIFSGVVQILVFLFIPSSRWSHRWPKLGGWYLVIKLHQNTTVHVLLLVFLSLINARNINRINFKGRQSDRAHSICSIFEDRTDRVFRNVGIYKSDAGESPKRKQTTFWTRRKLEIKKHKKELYRTNIFDKMGDHGLKMGRSTTEREEYVGQY